MKLGDFGTVGGYIYGIISMCTGEGVQGRELAWETLVETRGPGGGSWGHSVRDLAVDTSETETTGSVFSDRDRKGKGVRLMSDFQVDGGLHGNVGWWKN